MHENPISLAASLMALLTGVSALLVAIFKRGAKEGKNQSVIDNHTYQLGTLKAQTDMLQTGLGNFAAVVAKQEITNEHQGDFNRIREERENESNRRISTLEGRMDRR